MRIIGHHTCSKTGNISKIEENGPFQSNHQEGDTLQHKFLGTGYYFWDNNISMAHSHGQNNYRRQYYIFEATLNLPEHEFLDLAGNRIDMLDFEKSIDTINTLVDTQGWAIGNYLEFMKKTNNLPFRAIRATDHSIEPKKIFKFVANRRSFTNLSPVFIVCLLEKTRDLIQTFHHIKTFPHHG